MRDISKTVEKVAKGLCTTFNKIRYMSVNGRITHGMGVAMSLIWQRIHSEWQTGAEESWCAGLEKLKGACGCIQTPYSRPLNQPKM
jgi:hypothetical protein